ncbi:MAG: hypothetical protein ACRDZQ_06355 [Acidimicrobiales bacterium]
MPTLSFEGDTHDEIVRQVRRWLASQAGGPSRAGASGAVERASELTKDALTALAQAAPEPLSRNEVFRALTRMGYEATDSTRRAVVAALDALADTSDGAGGEGQALVKRIQRARNSVLYEVNAAVARQVVRSLTG